MTYLAVNEYFIQLGKFFLVAAAEAEERIHFADGLTAQPAFFQLFTYFLFADFIQLVDGSADVGQFVGFAYHFGNAGEDFAVVNLDDHGDSKRLENLIGNLHQFGFVEQAGAANDIHIALIELAIAALLGSVGTPYRLHLVTLEGK